MVTETEISTFIYQCNQRQIDYVHELNTLFEQGKTISDSEYLEVLENAMELRNFIYSMFYNYDTLEVNGTIVLRLEEPIEHEWEAKMDLLKQRHNIEMIPFIQTYAYNPIINVNQLISVSVGGGSDLPEGSTAFNILITNANNVPVWTVNTFGASFNDLFGGNPA